MCGANRWGFVDELRHRGLQPHMKPARLLVFALLLLAAVWVRALPPPAQQAVVVLADLGKSPAFGLDRMRAFLSPHSELEAILGDEYCLCLGYAPPDSPDKEADTRCLEELDRIDASNTSLVAVWLFPHLRGWKTLKVVSLGTHDGRQQLEVFGNRGRKVRLALDSTDSPGKRLAFEFLEINGTSIKALRAIERGSGQLCRSLKAWSVQNRSRGGR